MTLACHRLRAIKLHYCTLFFLIFLCPIGLRAEILPENFLGSFSVDPSVKSDSTKDNEISPAVVFTESTDSKQYNFYAHNIFYRLYPKQKYSIKGVWVQKQLAKKSKLDDYLPIVQAAWPDSDPEAIATVAKKVELWIKHNPEKPLLLISALNKEDAKPRAVIRVGGNVQASKLIQKSEPIYPQKAKDKRIKGSVIMEVLIDEKGIVESIVPKSGHRLLVPAAVASVQNWVYSPTTLNGEAVPILAIVIVNFQIR
jgi:TonB family protein